MPENQIKAVKLSAEAKDALAVGFQNNLTQETIRDIERWPTLVNMLNDYVLLERDVIDKDEDGNIIGHYKQTGQFALDNREDGGGSYEPNEHKIFISKWRFDTPYQNLAVVQLAHEVTHAFQERKPTSDYDTPFAYAADGHMREGEALYNEFLALSRIYIDYFDDPECGYTQEEKDQIKSFIKPTWRQNEAWPNGQEDLYQIMLGIVRPKSVVEDIEDPVQAELARLERLTKINLCATKNVDFIRTKLGEPPVPLTYNGFIRLEGSFSSDH